MEYQVWTKADYEEKWEKVDCGDIPAAKREIQKAIIAGKETLLTAAIPFEFFVKVEEGKLGDRLKVVGKKETATEVKKEELKSEAPES